MKKKFVPKKIKKSQIVEKIGNITYLKSNYDENKPKRKVSLEVRKKLSEERRKRTKQPREGQSKKANDFYKQLVKDYIKFNSASGKFIDNKTKEDIEKEEINELLIENDFEEIEEDIEIDEILNQSNETLNKYKREYKNRMDSLRLSLKRKKITEEEINNLNAEISFLNNQIICINEEIKRRNRKMSNKEKEISKNWIESNKDKLSNIKSEDGILFEYDIQKLNFNDVKMEESLLINLEEDSDDQSFQNRFDLDLYEKIDLELDKKHYYELFSYNYKNSSYNHELEKFQNAFELTINSFLKDQNIKNLYYYFNCKFNHFIFLNKEQNIIENILLNLLDIFEIFKYIVLFFEKEIQINNKLILEYTLNLFPDNLQIYKMLEFILE